MKKLFYITFFFLQFAISKLHSQTNVYHPFPNSDAVWEVLEWGTAPTPTMFKYYLDGDTMINATNYTKLKRAGWCIHCYANGFGGSCTQDTCYIGGLRNDTSQKKVYVLYGDSLNETLLFDFSLNIGDTNYYYNIVSKDPGIDTINFIDSVLIGQTYRKRFGFLGISGGVMIEGIGTHLGLMEPASFFEAGFELYCFKHGDTALYCPSVGITQFKSNIPITVFPNPSSEGIVVMFDNYAISGNIYIRCFNTLSSEEQISFFREQNQIHIKTTTLKEGLYFFQFYDNHQLISTEKIIIIQK